MAELFPDKSVAVVLGTRPEIIKLGLIISRLGSAAFVIHSRQHYDSGLSDTFFDAFRLPSPDVELAIGGTTRGQQIGAAVAAIDEVLGATDLSAMVVQGDTNTTLAGAIAANARNLPLVHVEAGLRSHDRRMPEEHNRVITDHLADLLCVPTPTASQNASDEGIPDDRIALTGNTIVEAVDHLMPDEAERSDLMENFGVVPEGFILSTFHRPENVDDPDRLSTILRALGQLEFPVLLPLHPRTRHRAAQHGMTGLLDRLQVIDPIGYREFLGLSAESAFLVSDSGGVQEEVSVYKKPVIVVRRSTERPEVIGTFARLVGPEQVVETASTWLSDLGAIKEQLRRTPSPYGDGTASGKILTEISRRYVRDPIKE